VVAVSAPEPTTLALGKLLLTRYMLPFEISSVTLLLALLHFSDASRELRAFAKQELSRVIPIDALLSFDRAPDLTLDMYSEYLSATRVLQVKQRTGTSISLISSRR